MNSYSCSYFLKKGYQFALESNHCMAFGTNRSTVGSHYFQLFWCSKYIVYRVIPEILTFEYWQHLKFSLLAHDWYLLWRSFVCNGVEHLFANSNSNYEMAVLGIRSFHAVQVILNFLGFMANHHINLNYSVVTDLFVRIIMQVRCWTWSDNEVTGHFRDTFGDLFFTFILFTYYLYF